MSISFWMDHADRPTRPQLGADLDVDVCIVGAGYTGLWTAYYLSLADPTLSIAVVEAHHVGFGASGRNGGWASAKVAGMDRLLANPSTRDAGARLTRAMIGTLDEIIRVVASEAIECGLAHGGTVLAATHSAQIARLKHSIDLKHTAGFTEVDARWMDAAEAAAMVNTNPNHGGTFTPHCLAVDPARLALGVAAAAERRGVRIFEHTRGTVAGRRVLTPGGSITAGTVVMATEAFGIEGRTAIPVYSLMVMTEPIGPEAWDEIGLSARQTFSDGRHMIIYGQRTADDRIAFGGRGAPYHYGSKVEASFDEDADTFDFLRRTLIELFPVLRDVAFEGAWGGPLAIPRDWRPSITYDRATGLARAGGYVGQGVAAAHLAGRTLADLITDRSSDLTDLVWVGHRSRRWEPEPLRWIGVNLGRKMTESIDAAENAGRRPRIRQAILDRLPIG